MYVRLPEHIAGVAVAIFAAPQYQHVELGVVPCRCCSHDEAGPFVYNMRLVRCGALQTDKHSTVSRQINACWKHARTLRQRQRV